MANIKSKHGIKAMNRVTALKLYASLMWTHGLIQEGWKPVLNTRTSQRLGCCNYGKKTLDVSAWHVDNGTDEAVKDTMLHEIAHALAGPRTGHGAKWQEVCRRIGANPQQYASSADRNKNLPYTLALVNDDGSITKLSRQTARRTSLKGKMLRDQPHTLNRLMWVES